MVRRPRVYFSGALYRVIAGGNQKQDIFLAEMGFRSESAIFNDSRPFGGICPAVGSLFGEKVGWSRFKEIAPYFSREPMRVREIRI